MCETTHRVTRDIRRPDRESNPPLAVLQPLVRDVRAVWTATESYKMAPRAMSVDCEARHVFYARVITRGCDCSLLVGNVGRLATLHQLMALMYLQPLDRY